MGKDLGLGEKVIISGKTYRHCHGHKNRSGRITIPSGKFLGYDERGIPGTLEKLDY